jgi:hypothetical protein
MKFLTTSIFILMFGLMSGAVKAASPCDFAGPHDNDRLVLSAACTPGTTDGSSVDITYLKDKDGKSYIISIRSEDERVNRMIRSMISAKDDPGMKAVPVSAGETLAITFYYENIR